MPTLTIDGQEITVAPGTTVLQACEELGIEVPRFCFHDRLSIAGNCRMCLVEQERAPKPIASCAMPAGEGMVIHTASPTAIKARKGVMEFLLINHPLDCPICDQGGECDLQDQAMAYGGDRSRYEENKRAVEDKELGPLIKTIMTRCIHCTRCVRFATEIAGIEELGATGRGENMEIGTYVEKALASELSGNMVDLCPVGALTSKPYAFSARPWELRKTESIDVHDAVGSNIRVDTRGPEVLRVLPRLNEDVNEEWISDKTRHAVDGLRRQRLDAPYVRRDGKLQRVTWGEAFEAIAARVADLDSSQIAAIAGDMADVETMFAVKSLLTALGSPHLDCRADGQKIPVLHRGDYLFNSTIAGIEEADAILMIGANPRWEAALVNARIRKRWTQEPTPIGVIGDAVDLTYSYMHIGAGPESLAALLRGDVAFSEILKNASKPLIILGNAALCRDDGESIYTMAKQLAGQCGALPSDGNDRWNGFNILHTAASRVGGLDIGFVPQEGGRDTAGILAGAGSGDIKMVWLLGADELDMTALGKAFVIYQGHHGDAGAHRADVILPGAAYTEKNAIWVNLEGRVQYGRRAGFPPGEAKEDWAIVRALSDMLGHSLPFNDLQALRQMLFQAHPHLAEDGGVMAGVMSDAESGTPEYDSAAFSTMYADFYLTNPICRASETMAECSRLFVTETGEATGTHG